MAKMQLKVLEALKFQCGASGCPKHQDQYNPQILNPRTLSEPISEQFAWKGCAQFRTFVYGVSDSPQSESEWKSAPLVGAVLPCPDPTGSQGTGNGHGVGRDIILEAIHAARGGQPTRVAILYLTRGYSFEKVYRGDILARHVNLAAVSHCSPYLYDEIEQLKPDSLLLCGPEVGDLFFSRQFNVPEYRRELDLKVRVKDREYPAQVTYNPHFCSVAPSYIKIVREDCVKIFEKPVPFRKGTYQLLTNFSDVMDYLDFLSEFDGFIGVDTETQNLNRRATNRLGTIQFATEPDHGVVIPYQHRETPFDGNELKMIAKRLKLLFGTKIRSAGWVGANLKFENNMFYQHFGTRLKSADLWDVLAMAFLEDETRSERKADVPRNMGIYTLKVLAWDYLYFNGYNQGILKEREEGTLIDLPLADLADYGALDAYIGLALKTAIEEKAAAQNYLRQITRLTRLYYGPASHLVTHVEYNGFKTDLKAVRELAAHRGPFNQRIENLLTEFKTMKPFIEANNILARKKNAGNPKGVMGTVPWVLDITKPAQKKLVFFDVMGLDPVSWSDKTGQAAVDDEFIEAYREENPEVEKYAQFSETEKMLDTFIVKALDRIDPETGDPDCRMDQRIRPSFWINRLVTGRWAVTNPNMQQIPKAEENVEADQFAVRKSVKDLYTVDPDCGLLQIDYKVNEVRWAAILAGDQVLARIFSEAAENLLAAQRAEDPALMKQAEFAEDIHRATASDMFSCTLDQVTKTQRSAAKAVTFGILFQQSAKALAVNLGCTEDEAQKYITMYFAKMVGVKNLVETLKLSAERKGFVEAPHGRRRRFWAHMLPLSWKGRRKHISRNARQAVNSPIQGVASDAAMIGGAYSLLEYIEDNNEPWIIQNLVHDSCIVQVPKDHVERAILLMPELFVDKAMARMTQMGVTFNLPLGIDVEVGIRWGTTDKWNGTRTHARELHQQVLDHWAKN